MTHEEKIAKLIYDITGDESLSLYDRIALLASLIQTGITQMKALQIALKARTAIDRLNQD